MNLPIYESSIGSVTERSLMPHLRSIAATTSVHVFVRGGKLQFGTWQGIFLCEFDGPRTRKVWVTVH